MGYLQGFGVTFRKLRQDGCVAIADDAVIGAFIDHGVDFVAKARVVGQMVVVDSHHSSTLGLEDVDQPQFTRNSDGVERTPAPGHCRFLRSNTTRLSRGQASRPDHAPPATPRAFIKPKAVSAAGALAISVSSMTPSWFASRAPTSGGGGKWRGP